ncbi:S8 family serine peptidase, partial [Candidatus Falkowbacteria bacterium]|nr:S8 family serine peptidase [Candidatus Falkowbacteria bacterium]
NHGTFVAGIIAALHNNLYVDGAAVNVKIMPLRALNSYGFGDSYPVAEAINYAIDNGADIINLSFGGVVHSQALKSAVLRAYEAGIVIVAAAGNNETGGVDIEQTIVYPICYDKEWEQNAVIGVSALDENDKKTGFSNFGAKCVDISAPGINFSGLAFHDSNNADFEGYALTEWRGTSFATALVSAAAALIKANHPEWRNDKITSILLAAAKNTDEINKDYAGKLGKGRLDMLSAATMANKENWNLVKFFSAGIGGNGVVTGFNADGKKIETLRVFGDNDVKGLSLAIADINKDGERDIVVGAAPAGLAWVRATKLSGEILSSFIAYPADYKAGVNVAAADVDEDGGVELIIVPASAAKPEVKIFSVDGSLKKSFVVAGIKNTGLSVDVGDVDKDGKIEIVVGTGAGVSPEVKIFSADGKLKKNLKVFVPQFKGGVNVRVRDIDADGRSEIIVAAGKGGGPQILVLDYAGKKLANFFAFDKKDKSGVVADALDIDADGAVELLAVQQTGATNKIKVFTIDGVFKKELTMADNFVANAVLVAK